MKSNISISKARYEPVKKQYVLLMVFLTSITSSCGIPHRGCIYQGDSIVVKANCREEKKDFDEAAKKLKGTNEIKTTKKKELNFERKTEKLLEEPEQQ